MTGRVLFDVPNALDTRRPLPLPGGPTFLQFCVGMGALFGSIIVAGIGLLLERDILSDLLLFLSLDAATLVIVSFKIKGHMLPYWLSNLNHLSMLRVIGRISWGFFTGYKVKDVQSAAPGGAPKKTSVFLAANAAHILYENTLVLEDGIADVSSLLLLPRWIRVFVSLLSGKAPYRQVLDVGEAALADTKDRAAQERLKHIRGGFWFRLNQTASAHAMIKPLDPEVIAYCAGPEEEAARALALGQLGQKNGLLQRYNTLVVQGPTVWFLKRNVKHAVSTLLNNGRSARVLSSDELNAILDHEWPNRKTPVEIDPSFVRIGTKRWVSYLITRLERHAPLDWTLAFLDGSIPHARIALYQQPFTSGGPFGALAKLTWRMTSWRAAVLGFDTEQFNNALADAQQVQNEIREPSSLLHKWGMVLTVPEDQKEEAEKQLKARYITDDGWRSAFTSQHGAAKASLTFGIGSSVDYATTNSSTLGLSTPWTGAGLWRPPVNNKPCTILLGYSLATAEAVGWYPFDRETQEAWNVFTWGLMGDGKTTTMQMISRRICKPHPNHYLAELKPRGLFIDHKTSLEYGGLVRDLGGEYIIATDWNDVKGVNVEQAALGINVSRIHPRVRGTFVYDLMRLLWDQISKRPISEPYPGVIGVDEMHMLALTQDGRWMISELGKMARDAWLTVLFGTQDMDDVLRADETAGVGADGLVAAAIKNSPTKIALRQPSMTRRLLQERLEMSNAECDLLINMGGEDGGDVRSSRGKCLVWAHGQSTPTQIVPLGREKEIFAMDPQERLALLGKSSSLFPDANPELDRSSIRTVLASDAGNRTQRVRSISRTSSYGRARRIRRR